MTSRVLALPLFLAGTLAIGACSGSDSTQEPSPGGGTPTAEPTQTQATGDTPTASQGQDTPTQQPGTPALNTPTESEGTPPTITPTQGGTPPAITPTAGEDVDRDGYPASVDCNDLDQDIFPGATETCDGKDEDCDSSVDEGLGATTQYPDEDKDGYGVDAGAIISCDAVTGYVELGGDCDDTDANINPGTIWYNDSDNDGFGADSDTLTQCEMPTGYLTEGGDCDDNDANHNPATPETCDNNDENCNGIVDDGTDCADDDGDGYCEGPTCNDGSTPGDCDDDAPWNSPDSPERYDFVDNNCDGQAETGRVFPLSLAHITLDGYLVAAQAGKALAGGGNYNGDTSSSGHDLDDLIIGAPNHDPEGRQVGAAFMVQGRETGWPGTPTGLDELPGVYTFTEDQGAAGAGDAVAFIGDINDDGIDDFAIGAPQSNGVSGQISQAGSAYVMLGKTDGWQSGTAPDLAVTRIDGTGIEIELGTSLAGGDVTGDGIDDFIVGAPSQSDGAAANSGWVFILPGTTGELPGLAGPASVVKFLGEAENGMGTTLTYLGNHDNSGFGTFAVAGLYDAISSGFVQRIPGTQEFGTAFQTFLRPANYRNGLWTGTRAGERTGYRLDGNIDVNGDGYTELLSGRHYRSDSGGTGIAYMIFGAASPDDETGPIEETADVVFTTGLVDPCPCSVAAIGDMDGDGWGDIAVSAAFAPPDDDPDSNDYQGRVFLIYGHADPWPSTIDLDTQADAIFVGVEPSGRAGYALSSAGDLNGDGLDDLAIGAPFVTHGEDEEAFNQAGRVYVQLGAQRP